MSNVREIYKQTSNGFQHFIQADKLSDPGDTLKYFICLEVVGSIVYCFVKSYLDRHGRGKLCPNCCRLALLPVWSRRAALMF